MKKQIKKILSYSPYNIYEIYRNKNEWRRIKKDQKVKINEYLQLQKIRKLQLGAGTNYLRTWLNTDLNYNNEVMYLDVSNKFPIPSGSFDYVFSEHLFEHLSLTSQMNMMMESYRILKRNGVMRIATPNLEFLYNLYGDPTSSEHRQYTQWAVNAIPNLRIVKESMDEENYYCYVINNFFRDWGHQMIHNVESIKELAIKAGFSEVRQCQVNNSTIPELNNIEKHGTIIPPQINLLETLVVEMVKL